MNKKEDIIKKIKSGSSLSFDDIVCIVACLLRVPDEVLDDLSDYL